MLAGTETAQNIRVSPVPRALTIAGSDSGGGAGIQADLKTFTSLGVYGMSVITAVTSQNTVAVRRVDTLPPEAIACQLQTVLDDIGTDAVKTGMLANREIIDTVSEVIISRGISCLVVDPVMVAKSGDLLLEHEAVAVLREKLLPLTMVFTPNIPEAEALLQTTITTVRDMEEGVKKLSDLGPKWVVMKGGHLAGEALDIAYDGRQLHHLKAERIKTSSTHGTGCTFSALITALLARGYGPLEAIHQAKLLLTWGIEHSLQLGSGHGPTNHFYFLRK